ncbi:MAG TPA: nuclear transport factor 2 family protein [Gemmatimonadaceae bacterium]|nr:nuclear transport factor 2 family protein [Gemmatimonadaceae bacterium]
MRAFSPFRLAAVAALVSLPACVSSSLREEPIGFTQQGTQRTDGALASVVAAHNSALVSRDIAALDTLLAPDLTFTQTSGLTQSKNELLAAIRSRTLVFASIQPRGTLVRQYGETAVATGTAQLAARSDGKSVDEPVQFTEVYVRRASRWQLVAYASTPTN